MTPALMTLRALVDSMTAGAKLILEQRDVLLPVVAVLDQEGKVHFIGLHFTNDVEKQAAYALVRREHPDALGFVAVNDSWWVTTGAENLWMNVKDIPGAVSALVVTVRSKRLGVHETTAYPYIRRTRGVEWKDAQFMDDDYNRLFDGA